MGRRPTGDRCTWRRISDYQGQPRWEVELWLDGRRTRQTCHSEEDARRAAKLLSAQIRRGTLNRPRTWEEAEAQFRTDRLEAGTRESSFQTTYPARFAAVRRTTGVEDPLSLTYEEGLSHKAARVAEGRSPATINGELDAITTLQQFFVKKTWLKAATWGEIKRLETEPRDVVLMPHEVGPFLRQAARLSASPPDGAREQDWWWWEAAAWAFMFGLRSNEATQLEVRDVDLVHGFFRIGMRPGFMVKSKRSKRLVPFAFSDSAVAVFRAAWDGRHPQEPCFPSRRGAHDVVDRDGKPVRIGGRFSRNGHHFRERCHLTAKLAGVTDVHPHALRHSLATVVAMDGGDIRSLAELLGHDPKVTDSTYTHTALGKQLAAARVAGSLLDRAVAGQPVLGILGGGNIRQINAEKGKGRPE